MTTQSLTAPMPIPQHRSSRTDQDSSSSHNSLSASPSSTSSSQSNQSYRELVKQITSQAPKPYGAIPPLIGRHKRKKRKKDDAIPPLTTTDHNTPSEEPQRAVVAIRVNDQEAPTSPRKPPLPRPMRSMSHVENWVAVDSKESLPDEEELEQTPSALRNFLSADFFTEVLPLHVPPPPLSDPESIKQQEEIARLADTLKQSRLADTEPTALDDDDTEEGFLSESEERRNSPLVLRKVRSMNDEDARWQDTRTTSIAKLRRPKPEAAPKRKSNIGHSLSRRHSLSSISRKSPTATTHHKPPLYPLPPQQVANEEEESWFTRLRRSFSGRNRTTPSGRKLIPMPPPPKRPTSQRRRSEATTQPRFNPATNTYMRDTRSNSDHLRMITAELNMMRARKLLSPLKPRGFLPRRRDAFVRGDISKRSSHLRRQVLLEDLEDQLEDEAPSVYDEDEDTE
ncbi:hypothetical protein INT44_001429 [Umbelopsis vinacea]|uniref:Uncharacterized protein n=1 Tax=Umbelopsis vinacea TaxID=44442 RepID=A0A8H7PRP1_9FUNG|nr:hypothetical protein INT44_001429 [Umbelopsis vinacea]